MYQFFVIVTILLYIAVQLSNKENEFDYVKPFCLKIKDPCCCIYENEKCVKADFTDKYVNVLEDDGHIILNISRYSKDYAIESIKAESLERAEIYVEVLLDDEYYPGAHVIPDEDPVYVNVYEDEREWISVKLEDHKDDLAIETIKCIDKGEARAIKYNIQSYYEQYRNINYV